MSRDVGPWEEEKVLDVKIFADDNYARVDILDEFGIPLATGTARRDPEDVPDLDIGIELATARAFASYVTKKNRRALGLIKHADEVRTSKAQKRANASFNNLNSHVPYVSFVSSVADWPFGRKW